MSRRESMSWLLTGAALWAVATATLAEFGGGGVLFRWYWPAVAIICAGFVGFFLLMLRWRKAPAFARLTAATCLALPGMVGEVPVLLTFRRWSRASVRPMRAHSARSCSVAIRPCSGSRSGRTSFKLRHGFAWRQ